MIFLKTLIRINYQTYAVIETSLENAYPNFTMQKLLEHKTFG